MNLTESILDRLYIIEQKIDYLISEQNKTRTVAHWTELPNEYMDNIDQYLDQVTADHGPRFQTPIEIADGAGIPPSNRMTRCVKSYVIDQVKLPIESLGSRTLVRVW